MQERRRLGVRAAGAAGALLIQLALVWVLMQQTRAPRPETIVYLPILEPGPPPMPLRLGSGPAAAVPSLRVPVPRFDFRSASRTAPLAMAPVAPQADVQGLHGALFGCNPDQILNEDDRRRCAAAAGAAKPPTSLDYADHTGRSHGAALWARGLARKQAPPLLPCASPQAAGIGLGTLLCLGKGLIDGGFDLDAQPGYMDRPTVEHMPNNGDSVHPYQPNQ